MPSEYRYDVFLSHSHYGEWPDWVNDHLLPILRQLLGDELGRKPEIFVDFDIEPGMAWPDEIRHALAGSRVMVPLWSRIYFGRDWCRQELSAMLARRDLFGTRGITQQIVFPLAVHDCRPPEDGAEHPLPAVVRSLQLEWIDRYCQVFMHKRSRKRERLADHLRPFCAKVARQIRLVPDDSVCWPLPEYAHYLDGMTTRPSRQVTPPSLGLS